MSAKSVKINFYFKATVGEENEQHGPKIDAELTIEKELGTQEESDRTGECVSIFLDCQ